MCLGLYSSAAFENYFPKFAPSWYGVSSWLFVRMWCGANCNGHSQAAANAPHTDGSSFAKLPGFASAASYCICIHRMQRMQFVKVALMHETHQFKLSARIWRYFKSVKSRAVTARYQPLQLQETLYTLI